MVLENGEPIYIGWIIRRGNTYWDGHGLIAVCHAAVPKRLLGAPNFWYPCTYAHTLRCRITEVGAVKRAGWECFMR